MIRDHHQVSAIADTERIDRRANPHQVVVAQSERLHRAHRAQAGHVLGQVRIMLPENDQRRPPRLGSALGRGHRVLSDQACEVQIALRVVNAGSRLRRHRGFYLLRLRRRLGEIVRREQIILMRLAERIFSVYDRLNPIIENRSRSLLANHRDIAALSRHFLRDSIQANQPALESSRPVQIDERARPLRGNHLAFRHLRNC